MKITIEMDSVHELKNLVNPKRTQYDMAKEVKKDPIWARELYEAYHRAIHPGQKGFFTKDAKWPEEAHEQSSFTMDEYDGLEDDLKQQWQEMANLIEEMRK